MSIKSQPKPCANLGSNVTVFTHANCSTGLSHCQVNISRTACENPKGCSPSLESYNYLCINHGLGACKLKSCTDTLLATYAHEQKS